MTTPAQRTRRVSSPLDSPPMSTGPLLLVQLLRRERRSTSTLTLNWTRSSMRTGSGPLTGRVTLCQGQSTQIHWTVIHTVRAMPAATIMRLFFVCKHLPGCVFVVVATLSCLHQMIPHTSPGDMDKGFTGSKWCTSLCIIMQGEFSGLASLTHEFYCSSVCVWILNGLTYWTYNV